MAVKVTGFFQNPQSGLIYDSPLLTLVPHLTYAGGISLDVNINNNGCIGYQSIDRSTLAYNTSITDPYSQLIDALETYIIDDLQNSNNINKIATIEKYVAPITQATSERQLETGDVTI